MGRKKLARLRAVAHERGWLAPEGALPDDTVLATLFVRPDGLLRQCVSSLEPWRDQIVAWRDEGIQGTTIHAALVRRHGYTGSYSSVHRFLSQLPPSVVAEVPLRRHFAPGEAAQVDGFWIEPCPPGDPQKKEAWLRGFLELPHGMPSHDTSSRAWLCRPRGPARRPNSATPPWSKR